MNRYLRQTVLPNIGEAGQKILQQSSVLIIGVGGLGCAVAPYLAAAGIGRIGLVDFDAVDVTNLQRQILFGQNTLGQSKVEKAKERLQDLNPEITIETYATALQNLEVPSLFQHYDIIVDGSDNFSTRYLINDTCTKLKKPNAYASVFQYQGQLSVYDGKGPCYRCLFPEPPQNALNCAEGGVLGVLPGVLGVLQATQVLKLLLNLGDQLVGRLLTFDAFSMQFSQMYFKKDEHCPACSQSASLIAIRRCERTTQRANY